MEKEKFNRYAINWNEEQRKYYFSLPPKAICQIDNEQQLVTIWDSFKEIKEEFEVVNTYVFKQGVSNAIRLGKRCKGYFWMYKEDYLTWQKNIKNNEQDLTKDLKYPIPNFSVPNRYKRVYMYEPPNRLEIEPDDYKNYPLDKSELVFRGRYEDAVQCSKKTGISVSNIREVLKLNKNLTKGYHFTFEPIFEDDDLIAEMEEQED